MAKKERWYAIASTRDDRTGERDLRFGFGTEDEATEYLTALNKRYDGRYDMQPLSQAHVYLLAPNEVPPEKDLVRRDNQGEN
jgi:hypothetical protein